MWIIVWARVLVHRTGLICLALQVAGETMKVSAARASGAFAHLSGSWHRLRPRARAEGKLKPREGWQVKEVLKALGGSWNKALGGWIFQGSKKDQVLRVLRKDPTNTVEEGSAPAPKKAKSKSADDEFINDDDSESALWVLFNGGTP